MIISLHPHRLAALLVVVPGAVFGGLAAVFSGPVGAALIIAMVAASLGVLVLSAEGFDRRWPGSRFGIAFVRLLPIVVTGGIAMMLFADPWVFDFGSTAALFYATLLIGGLATAAWFRYRSPITVGPIGAGEPSQPVPRFPMAMTQLHLMAAVAISAVLLPLGFLAGALAALGSGDGSIFSLVLFLTAVAVVIIVATSVKLDRNAKPQGAAVATGRVVAVTIAVLLALTTVVAVLDSAS